MYRKYGSATLHDAAIRGVRAANVDEAQFFRSSLHGLE
jgi:hypothetical protein